MTKGEKTMCDIETDKIHCRERGLLQEVFNIGL